MIVISFFSLLFAQVMSKMQHPNVIIILCDDLGFGDVSYNCHDNSTGMCAQTPNLLQLAKSKNSAVLHRFYATAGVCSPTRASILTGRNNQRDCITHGLGCDAEDPAPTCAMVCMTLQ
jgi:arylsulfatase A-like enzyme